MRKLLVFLATLCFLTCPALAVELKLPAIFSDNMVLQRHLANPVWGWADPSETITVSIADQRKQATADANGQWMVKLDSLPAGGPHEFVITGKKTITLKNVLIGEVWICSGQSNMEWSLDRAAGGPEAAKESANPQLRLFTVQKRPSDKPLEDVTGSWKEAGPDTTPRFSAVAYYFGRKLQKDLDVPVGLIHTSWGGTAIELWQSQPALEAEPEFKLLLEVYQQQRAAFAERKKQRDEAIAKAKAEGKTPPAALRPPMAPASLYNGMIAPLVPYGVAGAIWYQGESNAGRAELYRKQMPAMINHWRKDFGHGDFPFLMVQLANFTARNTEPVEQDWAYLREAQTMTTRNTPKVGMAVAIDIGEAADIHPRNKEDVGKRLALAALGIAYGRNISYSGPIYDSMRIEGDRVRIHFKHTGPGLTTGRDERNQRVPLKGFAIAGEDRKFVWADAVIEGHSVVVFSDKVPNPVAVRYGWSNNPEATLYNKDGLPASPFRTDDWPRSRP